jgi:Rrf2 family protein
MFRVSRRLEYGMQLLVALAADPQNSPQPTAFLSEKLEIPLPFLHQIGHTLMQTGMIKATPGPRGGLRLSQSPKEITVLQILEALEGPVCVTPSLDGRNNCDQVNGRVTQELWENLQGKITKELSQVTLDQLIDKAKKLPYYDFAFGKKS